MNQKVSHPEKTTLSLFRDTLENGFNSADTPLPCNDESTHCVLWLKSGEININNMSLKSGSGIALAPNDIITHSGATAELLRFTVSSDTLVSEVINSCINAHSKSELIASVPIQAPSNPVLIRLDQVDFPPAAVAYKHTHPGPGIRYLVEGELTLESESGIHVYKKTDAWFEGADHPVTATATSSSSSYFVRTMLLPIEFEGRSTFTLYNQSDADKPKRQTNTRHVELRITL